MKITLNITLLSTFLFIAFSCKDSSVTPKELQPGRRDYVWTVDTLNYPFSPIYRIWGSSPTDVWAVSPGDLGRNIFYFDGSKWSTDGVQRFIAPNSLWGFSANNVYMGGGGGEIWRYDGDDWKRTEVLKKDNDDYIVFSNIWGYSSLDFYAFGARADSIGYYNNSVIAHYHNGIWQLLNTDSLRGNVHHLYKNYGDNKIYLQSYRMGAGEFFDSSLIFEYNNGKAKKIYGNIWTRGLEADISLINYEVYFILGNEIARRVKDQFQTILKVDNPNFYQRIWGRNSKDIFLFMTDGLVHYNGSDMEYLFHLDKPRTQIYGAALFDKEVFFIIVEGQTHLNLIYHGKLKE